MIVLQTVLPPGVGTATPPGDATDAIEFDATGFAAIIAGAIALLPDPGATPVPVEHDAAPAAGETHAVPGPAGDAFAAFGGALVLAAAAVPPRSLAAPAASAARGAPASFDPDEGANAHAGHASAAPASRRHEGFAPRAGVADDRDALPVVELPATTGLEPSVSVVQGVAPPADGTQADRTGASPPGAGTAQPRALVLPPESASAPRPSLPPSDPPEVPAPRIDAAFGSIRWNEQFTGHVMLMLRSGHAHAEIRVDPPELGPIRARVAIDGGIANIAFSAPSAEARDALQAALTSLRERLAESGVALGEATVSGEHGSRDAPGGERSPAAAPAHGRDDGDRGASSPLPAGTSHRARLEGIVDLYA